MLSELNLDYNIIERKRSKNTIEEVLSNYNKYKNNNSVDHYTSIVQSE